MIVAVTTLNEQIFQHFGKSCEFTIVEMNGKEELSRKIIQADGAGHSALAVQLQKEHVDVVICGGMGNCARKAFAEMNIEVISGVKGHVDIALNKFGKGLLSDSEEGRCNHHHEGEEHHHCGH